MGVVKAYDIRGIVPHEIDQFLTHKVGKAVVSLLQARNVLVAHDMRTSSPQMEYALRYGIIGQGADALKAGLRSTPEFYHLLATGGYDAGVIVTASHNPKEYNGFKICKKNAVALSYETGLAQLEQMLAADSWATTGIGKLHTVQDMPYASFIAKHMSLTLGHRLVCDAGNGMAGHTLPTLLSQYPMVETQCLFFDLDGTFPNHEANPIKEENLTALKQAVLNTKAELGLAFDGDADRVGFVDELGKAVPGDIILCLLATHMLKANPGAAIVYDTRSTRALPEAIAQAGGTPVMWKGGHSRVKTKMLEVSALLGGEKSGHFFFRDFFSADCPDMAWLHVLRIMEETRQPLSALVAPFQKYFTGEEINFRVPSDPQEVLKMVEKRYKGKATYLDGLSMDMGTWWFNLRTSNTEPLLRLNLEAIDKDLFEEKKQELTALLNQ